MGLLDTTENPPGPTKNAENLIGAMSGVSPASAKRFRCLIARQVFQAGATINVFLASWVADKYGRKWAFHYCSLLSLLGGALLCGAQNVTMFIVARLFAGAGANGFLAISQRRLCHAETWN